MALDRVGGCGAIFAAIVVLYVQLFHLLSTGTTDLNYDHAWILINPVADGVGPGGSKPVAGVDPESIYSSPNSIVWWPGTRFFAWLDSYLRSSDIEKIALAVA